MVMQEMLRQEQTEFTLWAIKLLIRDLADISSYSYGGPQFAYTNGPLFIAAEYYYVRASRVDITL